MKVQLRRIALATAALGMLAAGLTAVFYSGSGTAVADNEFTIAITDKGFNPTLCIISRVAGDSVRWHNKGSVPHQVVSVNENQQNEPLFQTEVLQPGQTSGMYRFDFKSKLEYYDALNPSLIAVIEAGDTPSNCVEAPPTPTPTNTPSVSPTASPTRTPSPTATPDPRKAFIPMTSKDHDE